MMTKLPDPDVVNWCSYKSVEACVQFRRSGDCDSDKLASDEGQFKTPCYITKGMVEHLNSVDITTLDELKRTGPRQSYV